MLYSQSSLQGNSQFSWTRSKTSLIRLGRFPTFSICWCKFLSNECVTFHKVKRLSQSIAGGYSCSLTAQPLMYRFLGEKWSVVPGQNSWRHSGTVCVQPCHGLEVCVGSRLVTYPKSFSPNSSLNCHFSLLAATGVHLLNLEA